MRVRSTPVRTIRNLTALGAAAAITLTACSSGPSRPPAPNRPAPKDVTLVITANDISGGKNGAEADWITKQLIPAFVAHEAGNGVTAHVRFQANGIDDAQYKSKLALDLQSGSGADLFAMDGIWVGEFADAGYVRPLADVAGPAVDGWDGWQQIPPAVQALGEYDGKRYGVPNGTDGRVVFYNKKLFGQAGLATDWNPASWQDILDAGAKLKTLPGVTPIQWDAGVSYGEATTIQGFLPLLAGAGGTLWQDGKWVRPGQAFKDALGFYRDVYGGGLGDPVLQQDAKGRDKSFAEFAAGKIGIYAESDYLWRGVLDPATGSTRMPTRDADIGYALIPAKSAGSGIKGQSFVSYSGGSDWSMNPKSKYPQAAWDFLAFMNSKAETESRLNGAPKLTARSDVNQDVLANSPMLEFVNDKVLPITSFRPSLAAYDDVSTAVQNAVAEVVSGKSPDQAAADYAKALENVVGADAISG